MEADLHIHTSRYSGCSTLDPVTALRAAAQRGLGLIALTEHGIRWTDEAVEALVAESEVRGLLVLPAQEAACYSPGGVFQGEFLVYGYPESLGSNKSAEQLIRMVHAEGGVVVAAHPFKKSLRSDRFYGCGHEALGLDLDGLEIEHPSYDEESRNLARATMNRMGIAGIGCGDAHDLQGIGSCRTLLDDTVRSMEALCEAIRTRRARAIPRTGGYDR